MVDYLWCALIDVIHALVVQFHSSIALFYLLYTRERERERERDESVPYILYVVQFLLWKYVFECYRNTYQKCYCCLNTKTVVKTLVPNNPSVWQNFSNFEMHANLMGCIPKNKRVHAFIFVGFFFQIFCFCKKIYIYILIKKFLVKII